MSDGKFQKFIKRIVGVLPFIVLATIIIVVLILNEETSIKKNMELDAQINTLKAQIQLNKDSAEWYHQRRISVENGEDDLEQLARERYHMQKPTEDVFTYE